MLREIVFSCAGTTRKITDQITKGLDSEIEVIDLLNKDFQPISLENPEDVILIAVPVWGGRVPGIAADKLRQIQGHGQKAIAVVVYGNRDYDDALLELCDIATEQGFSIVSAAAFVAEHCIFPAVASARPDVSDHVAISRFIHETANLLRGEASLDLSRIKGKRPYKKAAGVPLHPKTDADSCGKCLVCVKSCPTDAINPETLVTDADKCITCCRCIAVCNNGARKFSGMAYTTVKFAFEKMCAKRREPELFV